MRIANRKRPIPNTLWKSPDFERLDQIAAAVSYVGSVEHKDVPNPLLSEPLPRPRSDASMCPRDIRDISVVNSWLKEAFRKGAVSDYFEGEFPRYVWYKKDEQVFMGRLINRINGNYKGFPIEKLEAPKELDNLFNEQVIV